MPDEVTTLGDNAFNACTGLRQITLGNRLASLGNYAFSGCSGITAMTIPDSVITIEAGLFRVAPA